MFQLPLCLSVLLAGSTCRISSFIFFFDFWTEIPTAFHCHCCIRVHSFRSTMASEPAKSNAREELQVPTEGRRMTRAQLSSNPQQKSKILLAKCRRSASDREHDAVQFGPVSFIRLPDKDFETTDQLRAAVFEILRKRLSNRMITGEQLSPEAVAWCLPSS
jgi:hypothetical protein